MSDRFKFEGEVTYGQMFNDLLPAIQAEDVAEYLEACIQYTMDVGNMDHDAAEDVVRQNIGYIAGYFSTETAARIHNLFKVSHPIFGTADTWESLTPEDMLKKGMELATEATEPTAAAQGGGVDDDAPFELGIHRFIPGLWRLSHVDGIASMELVAEEATDPKAELQKLIDKGLSIDAIKLYRKMYDSDLNTAQDAVLAMKHNKPTYAALEAALQQAQQRIAWADEILDTVETTAPKDWGGSSDPLPHDWYHAGQLVREYRAEYPAQASAQQAAQPADGEG